MAKRTVRFNYDDAVAAQSWRFNCGPGALCAVLNKTPNEIRPHLKSFEQKGYTNPKLCYEILDGLGVKYHTLCKRVERSGGFQYPAVVFGLVRVQWGGPWCNAGVPVQARYRHSHWIAMADGSTQVFDINSICAGGWMSFDEWNNLLVPWLCGECEPKWDGTWYATHAIEILS